MDYWVNVYRINDDDDPDLYSFQDEYYPDSKIFVFAHGKREARQLVREWLAGDQAKLGPAVLCNEMLVKCSWCSKRVTVEDEYQWEHSGGAAFCPDCAKLRFKVKREDFMLDGVDDAVYVALYDYATVEREFNKWLAAQKEAGKISDEQADEWVSPHFGRMYRR